MIGNRTGSVGSAFNPKSISGLCFWLDGSDPAGNGVAPTNGTGLASWVDKSGTGNTVVQASGPAQPIFNTNVKAGKGAITVTSGQYMRKGSAPTNFSFGSTGRTMFAVVGGIGVGNPGCVFSYGTPTDQQAVFFFPSGSGGGSGYLTLDIWAGAIVSSTTQLINTNFYVEEINYTAASNINTASFIVNGTTQATSGDSVALNTVDNGDMQICVFPVPFGASFPYEGTLCELIMYNVSLSSPNQTTVRNYLSKKWGI